MLFLFSLTAFQGYTPLHLAMQFEKEEIFNLLVQVYGEFFDSFAFRRRPSLTLMPFPGADQNLRDWSGRKARQYQVSLDTSVSADTFRSKSLPKADLHRTKTVPRGFSQKVSVKKSTSLSAHFLQGHPSRRGLFFSASGASGPRDVNLA